MNSSIPVAKKASTLEALRAAFSKQVYFSLVLTHDLASELGSEQIASAYKSGSWPASDWPAHTLERAQEDYSKLKRSVILSASVASLLALLTLIVGLAFGKVHPSLILDFEKVLVSFGLWLITWGALLSLYPPRQSYRTDLLHEVSHATLLKTLFIIGTVATAMGAIWW